MADVTLPLTLDGLTAHWLTDALSVRYPGVVVTSAQIDQVEAGSATKVRILVEYNDDEWAQGLPPVLYVKGGFDEGMRRRVWKGYLNEVKFYSLVAPELPIEVPACFFAGADEHQKQAIVLLEDLVARDVAFGRATRLVDVDTAAATLDLQARYHAHWWRSARLREFQWRDQFSQFVRYLLRPSNWERCMALPRAAVVADHLRERDAAVAAVDRMFELGESLPPCLIHGDAHLGNMYFRPDGSPGYLDWQAAQRGPWADDVAYFLAGSIDVEDRRAHERDLLAHYLDRLRSYGVDEPPSFDDAWLAYRRHVIHGFTWLVNPDDQQPEDITVAETRLFAVAVEDLDTFEALR